MMYQTLFSKFSFKSDHSDEQSCLSQGRRKQLESGEAVRRISIQEVLFSFLIVAEGNSASKGSSF